MILNTECSAPWTGVKWSRHVLVKYRNVCAYWEGVHLQLVCVCVFSVSIPFVAFLLPRFLVPPSFPFILFLLFPPLSSPSFPFPFSLPFPFRFPSFSLLFPFLFPSVSIPFPFFLFPTFPFPFGYFPDPFPWWQCSTFLARLLGCPGTTSRCCAVVHIHGGCCLNIAGAEPSMSIWAIFICCTEILKQASRNLLAFFLFWFAFPVYFHASWYAFVSIEFSLCSVVWFHSRVFRFCFHCLFTFMFTIVPIL